MRTQNLREAKKKKDDEFYTRLIDIQKELDRYDFYNLGSHCYNQQSFLINRPEGQTSELSIKHYKPIQQSSKEYIQASETGYVQTYKIMPCDKSYFTKIIINYDPSLLVPYRR